MNEYTVWTPELTQSVTIKADKIDILETGHVVFYVGDELIAVVPACFTVQRVAAPEEIKLPDALVTEYDFVVR